MVYSAGILMYRKLGSILEFLLFKPGGPFYTKKNRGVWTISKGEILECETNEEAARREFMEETGLSIDGNLKFLGDFKLRKGKTVAVFLIAGNFKVNSISSQMIELEHPKDSGNHISFPEMEQAKWFKAEMAVEYIMPSQGKIIEAAIKVLKN
ncbi:NUDIX domain-containing protein [bacterium]|nr:NUDIX domain-containing protein [bacterium]